MSRYVNEDGQDFYEFELEDMFEQELNDMYEPVNVAGYEFNIGRLLRQADPTAFSSEYLDWLDWMLKDNRLMEVE